MKRTLLWKIDVVISIIIALSLSLSCSQMLSEAKPFNRMTTKEKAVYLMSMYNKQYDEYLNLYKKGNYSEAEVKVLQTKHKFLKELHPYIGLYVSYADSGQLPPEEVERKLIAIINRSIQN